MEWSVAKGECSWVDLKERLRVFHVPFPQLIQERWGAVNCSHSRLNSGKAQTITSSLPSPGIFPTPLKRSDLRPCCRQKLSLTNTIPYKAWAKPRFYLQVCRERAYSYTIKNKSLKCCLGNTLWMRYRWKKKIQNSACSLTDGQLREWGWGGVGWEGSIWIDLEKGRKDWTSFTNSVSLPWSALFIFN